MADGTVVAPQSRWWRGWVEINDNSRIPLACKAHQERLVQARIAAFSRALAVLTLAWIPIDAASIGIASLAPDEAAAALIARADEALYAAKQTGRNRCLAAPMPLAAPAALATCS